ncbi:uncharacterized protein LOC131669893 isoform X1 [Phymastichus coffea]|uniref:uncharacterized protein LOC131669893 isoform X1 n=1 Tax=Phymastichus coffea TaxID=108790 RepID=UPI00273A9B3D|nr:uncharacterized protein LOC131669893 isoform X1 [Phymastichus coffea]
MLSLLSIAICLTHLLWTSDAAVEVVNQKNSVHTGYLMIDSYSFKEGNLVYGICNGHKEQINCTIVQAKHPYANATHTCNVTLNAEQKDAEIYSRIGLAALGQDKAVIFWHEEGEKTYLKLGTVQMNNCKLKEAKVPDVQTVSYIDLFHSQKIVTYKGDIYDVVFQDPKLCGDKACKMTIDAQGAVIKEPSAYITTNGQFMAVVSPIATRSPINGLIYTIIESNKSILWMITSDGTEKKIAEYEGYPIRTVSSSHDMISVCSKPNRDSDMTNCTQYDKEGSIKITVNLTDTNDKTNTLIVHNLAKGGFLLMLVEYEKCEKNDCANELAYKLIRIDEGGKRAGSLKLSEFESVAGKKEWAYIYDAGDDKYCAVLIGNELSTPHGDSHVVSNCFAIGDFSK